MAKPLTIHTVESLLARAIEVGDCMEWTGYCQSGVPYVSVGNHTLMSVRRVLAGMLGIGSVNAAFWSTSCGNQKCVNPEHIVGRSRVQHATHMARSVDHYGALRVSKLQASARSRSVCKLREEDANAIRFDPRPCSVVAEEYGVSKSLVSKIKRGDVWRPVSAAANPWAGLM